MSNSSSHALLDHGWRSICSPKCSRKESVNYKIIIIFFNVGPPKENIFLTTFYGLYFQSKMHKYFTDYNFLWGLWGQLPCTASTPLSFDLMWALHFFFFFFYPTPTCCHARVANLSLDLLCSLVVLVETFICLGVIFRQNSKIWINFTLWVLSCEWFFDFTTL